VSGRCTDTFVGDFLDRMSGGTGPGPCLKGRFSLIGFADDAVLSSSGNVSRLYPRFRERSRLTCQQVRNFVRGPIVMTGGARPSPSEMATEGTADRIMAAMDHVQSGPSHSNMGL
jgi:hypothetical protein